jgi:UPF0716 protein FxsA
MCAFDASNSVPMFLNTMLPLLFLAFTIIPVVEIALFIRIGGAIGLVPTVAVVLLTGFAGAVLAQSQGIRVMLEVQKALQEMRLPAGELVEGAIVLVGAATLLTPGFMTDALGLACLIPPSRKVLAAGLTRYLARRIRLAGDDRGGVSGGTDFGTAGNFAFRFGAVEPGKNHPEQAQASEATAARVQHPIGAPEPRTIDATFTVIDGGKDDDG